MPESFNVDLKGKCDDPGQSQSISALEIPNALNETHICVCTMQQQKTMVDQPYESLFPVTLEPKPSRHEGKTMIKGCSLWTLSQLPVCNFTADTMELYETFKAVGARNKTFDVHLKNETTVQC